MRKTVVRLLPPSIRRILLGLMGRLPDPSNFFHYAATFDALHVIKAHAARSAPSPIYHTNYLGLRIDPKFLAGAGVRLSPGAVEGPPIPANWHADIAEWAAALRAVDLAKSTFTAVELGCGWGCWIYNTGLAARHRGLSVRLTGIEADAGHVAFAREAAEANGFASAEVTLLHAVAAAQKGIALFPLQQAGSHWGLEPIFDPPPEQRRSTLAAGSHTEVPMVSLTDTVQQLDRVDLLHIDIQGSEADLVERCLAALDRHVAYIVIGTHSRQIEGRLVDVLLRAGWTLEIERPAILDLVGGPSLRVDGVQGWRNDRLIR